MRHQRIPARMGGVAAAALAAVACAEVVARHDGSTALPFQLLLAVAGTLPLALAPSRRWRWLAAGTLLAANLLLWLGYREPTVGGTLALLTMVVIGSLSTTREARHRAAERDTNRQAVESTLLEHAARGERARIARDLHDVVAHHISLIAVQAETARLATPGMPVAGANQLLQIGDTARLALTEMRRLLGVLREDAEDEAATPSRRPQPRLQELNELVDAARGASGASVRLIVRGPVIPLDPGVELTVYRIVQEALTNARRHAPGAAVDVELTYGDGMVHLQVRDMGPGPPGPAGPAGRPGTTPGGGSPNGSAASHGLLGMQERAAAVGGELHAGLGPGGGFVVEARMPAA